MNKLVYKYHHYIPWNGIRHDIDTVELSKVEKIAQAGIELEIMYIQLKDGTDIGLNDIIIDEITFE